MSDPLHGALAGRRVLLTGAGGFTGPYVRRRLESAGATVTGLLRPGEAGAAQDIACEITDAPALRGAVAEARPDHVIHLAAISFVPFADSGALMEINVRGTRNLLEACAALSQAPRKIILASSANVYGNAPVSPIREDAPLAPASDYAASKVEVERLAAEWGARLPILLVRPFNYTGVGQDEKFLVPKLVAAFRRRDAELSMGRTDVVRDFSDVRWVAEAYARLLAADVKAGSLAPEAIDESEIRARLYTANFPDPDLLIRTSGEQRLSNFLLWQVAYAELYISSVLWPDFGRTALYEAILDFQRRDRRFGRVSV